jgi:hypothetical protein
LNDPDHRQQSGMTAVILLSAQDTQSSFASELH